jgi:hypothetical protein
MHGNQTVKNFPIEAHLHEKTLNLFGIPPEGRLTDKNISRAAQIREKTYFKAVEFETEGGFEQLKSITNISDIGG